MTSVPPVKTLDHRPRYPKNALAASAELARQPGSGSHHALIGESASQREGACTSCRVLRLAVDADGSHSDHIFGTHW